jgi:putative DNA primase/helicase
MNDTFHLDCGPADDAGRRLVMARFGDADHRDWFNTDDAFRRKRFAEATLDRFGWAITAEVLADIDAKIVQVADSEDARKATPTRVKADSVCLADVPAAEVDWLWPGRIAVGKVTLLAGDPGLGKSFVTLDMAARVSTGAPWPEVGPPSRGGLLNGDSVVPGPARLAGPTGGVVLLSAEDDLADTVRPRLEAAGADCSRIVAIRAIAGDDAEGAYRRTFELGRDLSHLTSIVESMRDCRLVVIDPISAYLGKTGENFNAEVRALMGPLADVASRHQLAVVSVTHLRKGEGAAIYRAMGSLAFVAAARSAWMITKDPSQPSRRLLLPMKNNLGNDATGMAYEIESRVGGGAFVRWSDEVVQAPANDSTSSKFGRPSNERSEATQWLTQLLSAGQLPTAEVHDAAAAAGYSLTTIRRAFREIGGKAVKVGNGWQWKLADHKEPNQDDQKSDCRLMTILTAEGLPPAATAEISSAIES